MKKVFLFVVLAPLLSLGQHAKRSYLITGHINGVVGKNIFLMPAYSPDFSKDDTVITQFSENGDFVFKGPFKETKLLNLKVEGIKMSRAFILERGTITIIGDTSDLINAKVSGGKENRVYEEYKTLIASLNSKNQVILKKLSDAKKNGDTLAYKQYLREWNEMGSIYEKSYEDFIKKNSASFVALIICRYNTIGSPELAKKYLSLVDKALKEHKTYKEMERRIFAEASLVVNKVAPNFIQSTKEGSLFSLSSLKGKFVLLDFWASWCVPCRKESPNLVQAYSTFASKGFEIVSISLDNDRKKWLKAIDEDGYKWINVSDLEGFGNKVALQYSISAIPKNFLLDKEGKIIAINLFGEALRKKLNEIIE